MSKTERERKGGDRERTTEESEKTDRHENRARTRERTRKSPSAHLSRSASHKAFLRRPPTRASTARPA